MNLEQWRELVREVLTNLAHDARHALSHEDYEAALDVAERWVMMTLEQAIGDAGPVANPQPRQGTWDYQTSWGGHYRLLDAEGRLVGYVVREPSGEWKAVFQPGMALPEGN